MRIEFDTLKCAKILSSKGYSLRQAEALSSAIASMEIRNLFDKTEVNNMLADVVKNVLEECRREFDKQFSLTEKRVNSEIASLNARISTELAEARAGRRWVIGSIITVGIALAGYLSALIHFAR